MPRFGEKLQALFANLTGRPLFWVVVIALAFTAPLARSVTRQLPPPPMVYSTLPEFELVDHHGEPFGTSDLRGKVWIANFIFTTCGEVCPKLTTRMRELQSRLENVGDAVHLVSFSVDPVRDTPEVLRRYAESYNAREGRWTFLTGSLDVIRDTVVEGFKVGMEQTEVEDMGFFDIVHGERFVLVDQIGQVRGYFDSGEDLQSLLNQAGLLANLGPGLPNDPSLVVSYH